MIKEHYSILSRLALIGSTVLLLLMVVNFIYLAKDIETDLVDIGKQRADIIDDILDRHSLFIDLLMSTKNVHDHIKSETYTSKLYEKNKSLSGVELYEDSKYISSFKNINDEYTYIIDDIFYEEMSLSRITNETMVMVKIGVKTIATYIKVSTFKENLHPDYNVFIFHRDSHVNNMYSDIPDTKSFDLDEITSNSGNTFRYKGRLVYSHYIDEYKIQVVTCVNYKKVAIDLLHYAIAELVITLLLMILLLGAVYNVILIEKNSECSLIIELLDKAIGTPEIYNVPTPSRCRW